MVVHAPAQIADGGFVDWTGYLRKIRRDVMFKALLADEAKQFLEPWNSGYPGASEGFEWIVGEFSLAYIASDLAVEVVGGESDVGHGAGFDAADAGAKGVLLAYRSGDDRLEVHD